MNLRDVPAKGACGRRWHILGQKIRFALYIATIVRHFETASRIDFNFLKPEYGIKAARKCYEGCLRGAVVVRLAEAALGDREGRTSVGRTQLAAPLGAVDPATFISI